MGRARRPGAPTRALSMGPNKRICGKQALFRIKRLGRPAAAVAGDQLEPLDTTHRLFLGSIRPQEVLTDLAGNAVSSGVEFGACLKEYAPSLASTSRTHHHELLSFLATWPEALQQRGGGLATSAYPLDTCYT